MLCLFGSKAADNLTHEQLVHILYTKNTDTVQNVHNFIRRGIGNIHPSHVHYLKYTKHIDREQENIMYILDDKGLITYSIVYPSKANEGMKKKKLCRFLV